jgi:hypothetical protein
MNHSTLIRATAAAFAAIATLGLLNWVVSLSEPQRSTLIAATQSRQAHSTPSQAPATQTIVVAGSAQ